MPGNQIEIDYGDLLRRLKDVRDYLAELRYIDLAQQRIHDHNKAATLSGLANSDDSYEWFNLELGTRYPFTESMLVPFPAIRTGQAQANELLIPLLAEAHQWTESQMVYLDHRIQEIMHYRHNGYAPMDWHLEKVSNSLAGVDSNFGFLEGELSRWTGTAATDFRSGFYSKYRTVRENQLRLVEGLRAALTVSRRSIEYSQQSAINAVTSTREALLDQLRLRSIRVTGKTEKVVLLATAGMYSVIAVLLPPAGLWAAAVATAIAFGASVAASELPPASIEDDQLIEGVSAEELHLDLHAAIQKVESFLYRNLDELHDNLRSVRSEVGSLYRPHEIIPKRPHITDGASPAEFHHSSSGEYP